MTPEDKFVGDAAEAEAIIASLERAITDEEEDDEE